MRMKMPVKYSAHQLHSLSKLQGNMEPLVHIINMPSETRVCLLVMRELIQEVQPHSLTEEVDQINTPIPNSDATSRMKK